MKIDEKISYRQLINKFPSYEYQDLLDEKVLNLLKKLHYKIIVLDDDPTGTQTMHSVPVYTQFNEHTINEAFLDESETIYILTNSRALSEEDTKKLHLYLGETIEKISEIQQKKYILISRGDSTLRGHYPLEIDCLYKANPIYNGEIIIPSFFEGDRYTYKDIHYLKEGDTLIPVHKSEFASDKTFGYSTGHLPSYIKEKSDNKVDDDSIITISIEALRKRDIQGIKDKITQNKVYSRIIVNALNESDLKIFSIAILELIDEGYTYLFRTAASFVRVISATSPIDSIIPVVKKGKGLIIVGSHVHTTTEQLNYLKNNTKDIHFIEFDVNKLHHPDTKEEEINRVIIESDISDKTICIYTSRRHVSPLSKNKDKLTFSTQVSEYLVEIVQQIKWEPSFILSKGGITSSDIAVKGLNIKKAAVKGQIEKGISVWFGDKDSKFPETPYIVFPGNVGNAHMLKDIYDKLMG